MNDYDVSMRVAGALFGAFNKAKPAHPPEPVRPPFSIAISRQAGALGKTVATEIARRLGWPVYDKEILDKVAEQMRKPTFRVEGIDERPVNWLEDCLRAFSLAEHVNPSAYHKHLVGVVRGLGLIGRCVIVGRGATCILPPETTLRVRLVAELPDRQKVMARLHKLSPAEAARLVDKTDKERTNFVRSHFRTDATAAEQYDLVLNTSRMSPEECAQTVIGVLRLFEVRAAEKHELAKELVGSA
jgi:cytidylate kinase